MNQNDIMDILSKYDTVAIVGLSRSHSKDSYKVAKYLKKNGFQILPINPFADELLGEKCYKSLLDIPATIQKTIEIVNIFRPSEDVLPIAEQVVRLKKQHEVPHVLWMQLGIINKQAAELARKVNVIVVMNKCIKQEHHRLFSPGI